MSTNYRLKSPSLLKGVARTLDLFGSLDSLAYSRASDAKLLKGDWQQTGKDLRQSLIRYGKKSVSY